FFIHPPPPPPLSPLSLHDALPIFAGPLCGGAIASPFRVRATVSANAETTPAMGRRRGPAITMAASADRQAEAPYSPGAPSDGRPDRKSTRLNSSHVAISYAVFCLK